MGKSGADSVDAAAGLGADSLRFLLKLGGKCGISVCFARYGGFRGIGSNGPCKFRKQVKAWQSISAAAGMSVDKL